MNILVTSAGRRGYIIRFFKEALQGQGKVYAGNSTAFSSAFAYADESVVTPLIYEQEYIPFLIEYCQEKQIEVIISLFDVDLYVLAQHQDEFREMGIRVIVSNENIISICNDKWLTYRWAKEHNIEVPNTYLKVDAVTQEISESKINYPVVVKPRWGMGSIGIFIADNEQELMVFYLKCKEKIQNSYLKYEAAFDFENCVIIQEMISGNEYGMDVINDLNGKFCTNVVRKKIAMRSGETDCAVVVRDEQMDLLAEKLGKELKHVGNLDVDVFQSDERIVLLEMNARFGGGYPFSHYAGINLPGAIVKWLEGKELEDELEIKKYGEILQKDIGFVNLTCFTRGL